MEREDFERIHDEAVRLVKNGSTIQGLIHILGCYGCVAEWKSIRDLLMKDHPKNYRFTDSYFHAISVLYNKGCDSRILKEFGRDAWQHTLTYCY